MMDIFEQLRRDEALRLKVYLDTQGKQTIGYGRNLSDKGISPIEAETLLDNDVQEMRQTLIARLPWFTSLDIPRQGVILNMAFNMGFEGLEKFPKFLMACAQGDFPTAAEEMHNSLWDREVGQRAIRLEEQMRTGEWV
jgi:lysozyme